MVQVIEEWFNQWGYEQALHPAILGGQRFSGFMQSTSKTASFVHLSIEMTLGGATGPLSLCVPEVMVEPLLRSFQTRQEKCSPTNPSCVNPAGILLLKRCWCRSRRIGTPLPSRSPNFPISRSALSCRCPRVSWSRLRSLSAPKKNLSAPSGSKVNASLSLLPRPLANFSPYPSWKKSLDLVLDIKVNVAVQLGSCELPMREVLALEPGTILQLAQKANEPVSLRESETRRSGRSRTRRRKFWYSRHRIRGTRQMRSPTLTVSIHRPRRLALWSVGLVFSGALL